MAPIYIAKNLSNAKSTPPLFLTQGAEGLAPEMPSKLHLFAYPAEQQLAYQGYAANIDAFLMATAANKNVFCGAEGFDFVPRHILSIAEPPVKWILQKPITENQLAGYMKYLGAQSSYTKEGKTIVFTCPNPSTELFDHILKFSTVNVTTGSDAVSPRGLWLLRLLKGIIGTFLATQTYPAFSAGGDEGYMELDQLIPRNGTSGGVNLVLFDKRKTTKVEDVKNFVDAGVKGKWEAAADGDIEMESVVPGWVTDKPQGVLSMPVKDSVVKAKPSPASAENNYGSIHQIPDLPGLAFPYFDGMITSDPITILAFINDFGRRLLGANRSLIQARFEEAKHAVGSLVGTNVGKQLCHIAICLKLTLQAQARPFVVIDGTGYRGFAMLGSGFAIFNQSRWHAVETAGELRKSLANMDSHAKAVEEIRALLEGLRMEDPPLYTGSMTFTLKEPKELVLLIEGLKLNEIDEKDIASLDRAVRRLDYRGEGFRHSGTPDQLKWFLTKYFGGEETSLVAPTYIPSIRAPLDSRAFHLLSHFGPDAPSLWNGSKGQEYPCRGLEETVVVDGKRKKSEKVDKYGNMPEVILITPKPLLIAVRDWDTVVKRGAVKMNMAERAKNHRNKGVEDDTVRKGLWDLLVDGLSSVKRQDTGKGKTKEVAAAGFDDFFASLV